MRPLARFGALDIAGETVARFVEKPSDEGGPINGGFWQPMDTLRDKTHLEELRASGAPPWKTW